ncbi:MAG: DUF4157 domain-containing protein [Anaerolineales bacterium]|nr:DUF4157 domain-containing protein [Anaerolineales bacterium]
MTHERSLDEGKVKRQKPVEDGLEKERSASADGDKTGLTSLQQIVGNQAVQRLITQRSGEGPFELDDETAGRISQARGGGQALEAGLQEQMGAATGQDFSGVRVHNSPEADEINQQLNARAFTTGQDIFFREGAYDPHSSSGQELVAHELTHVVQQTTGQVSAQGSRMTVNAPGDRFEREADSQAKTLVSAGAAAKLQRQDAQALQRQVPEEEEETAQRQAIPEEEETLQRQEIPEEETEV